MKSDKAYIGLGRVPIGKGAILRGWDLTEEDFRNSLAVVDFRAMAGTCPHNCLHCFTDKSLRTLSLGEIKRVIDQIADMGARAIDFLGEGEPTTDPDFFKIVEYTADRGIIPVIFTEAAAKLRNRDFVGRLWDIGASVSPKCDSLFSAEYQNWIVRDTTGSYFDQRNEAIGVLMEKGFNRIEPDGTTRLGFDMIVSTKNIGEVADTLRFCRANNLWIVFSFYLPAGRSGSKDFDQSLVLGQDARQKMRELIVSMDQFFGFNHPTWNNFATMPCIERMQVYGDGRVSPCPGNETVIGMIQDHSIQELHQMIIDRFPGHNPACFDGNCLYRPKV